MARIRAFGATFHAEPLEDLGNGTYRMCAREHTTRTSPGTIIIVAKAEILEMSAAETPGPGTTVQPSAPAPSNAGLATVEAAMAAERKTLPSFAEATRRNTQAKAAPAVSVPADPT